MRTTLFGLMLAALAAAPGAQCPDHHRPTLTHALAKRVVDAAVQMARQNHVGGAFAVVDDGGNLLCLERLDDTFAAAAMVSVGKARTAAMFRKPTSVFEKLVNGGRTTMVALPDFTPLQGGVPLLLDGQFVGAVGVSGAASAQQDEEFAIAAAASLMAADVPMRDAVAMFPHGEVEAAFKVGAPLLEVDRFKIHASRREVAGRAEVHADETDVIYVLSGKATFVTGGEVVDPEPTGPGEVRGGSIAGGDTRALVPGDVVVVPKGTPHWFRDVQGPLLYYVVKVID